MSLPVLPPYSVFLILWLDWRFTDSGQIMILTQLPELVKWLPISRHLNPRPASTPPTNPLFVPLYPAGRLAAPWPLRTFTLAAPSA